VDYDFSINNPDRSLKLFTTLLPTPTTRAKGPQQFSVDQFSSPLTSISRRTGGANTRAYTLKGDISNDFVVGGLNLEFKAGALYTDRVKTLKQETFTATAAQLTAAGLPIPTQDTFALPRPFLGNIAQGYEFRYHSKRALEAYVLDLQTRGIATEQRATDSAAYWEVGDEILAGYVMGKLDFDWGNVVAGARVERCVEDRDRLARRASALERRHDQASVVENGALARREAPDASVRRLGDDNAMLVAMRHHVVRVVGLRDDAVQSPSFKVPDLADVAGRVVLCGKVRDKAVALGRVIVVADECRAVGGRASRYEDVRAGAKAHRKDREEETKTHFQSAVNDSSVNI
jgi:hypothetical protein